MTIKTEALQLLRSLGYCEGGLADLVHELSLAQKQRVAEFVRKHEFLPAAQALYVNTAELEQLLRDTSHGQCEVCEEWFTADQLVVPEEDDDAEPDDDDVAPLIMCAGCAEEMS